MLESACYPDACALVRKRMSFKIKALHQIVFLQCYSIDLLCFGFHIIYDEFFVVLLNKIKKIYMHKSSTRSKWLCNPLLGSDPPVENHCSQYWHVDVLRLGLLSCMRNLVNIWACGVELRQPDVMVAHWNLLPSHWEGIRWKWTDFYKISHH